MPETGKNKSVRGGGVFTLKAKDSGISWDFCYEVGNRLKTLLAGKLHVLWSMGMGHPSEQGGFELFGLAARFITSCHPAWIMMGGISASELGHGETVP